MKKTIPILIFINNLSIKISALFLLKPLAYRLPFCCKRNKLLNYPERINRRAIYSSSIISKPEDIAASKGNAKALKEVNELKDSKMIIPLYFLLFFNIKKENAPDEKSKWF